jgi:hypothetical protein
MSPPDDLDRLSHAELKGLVVKQWEQMVELQRVVMALRDEVARLKGGPGRPNIKPSRMERGTEPKRPGGPGDRKRPRGSTRSKLTIDEEQAVKVAARHPGTGPTLQFRSAVDSWVGWRLPSEGKGHTFESCRVRQFLFMSQGDAVLQQDPWSGTHFARVSDQNVKCRRD